MKPGFYIKTKQGSRNQKESFVLLILKEIVPNFVTNMKLHNHKSVWQTMKHENMTKKEETMIKTNLYEGMEQPTAKGLQF